MADTHDNPQEQLVRQYLTRELDGQLGRAEDRFRQYLAQQQSPQTNLSRFYLPNRFRNWTFGVLGTALAASLAALWAGPSLQTLSPHDGGTTAPGITPTTPVVVEQDVNSQTFDDGTFMAGDNTAIRVYRRHDVERTRWFDRDKKLQGEQIVPQDHVVYVQMKTY